MDKLKMHSPNLTDENIEKLAALFPNCVTEARDEQGNLKRAIDLDQLRQELSDHIVEGPQERYHLNWPGKREALLAANAPIAKTLRPCREESVDFDTTRNLFIEGDNLEALKLLQETYLGKVKMIYIDPPYNTGSDFVYEDDFSETSREFLMRSNQVDDSGNRLIANTASNGRFHSDQGVIFISIDDNEAHSLKKICDEIFGENCLRANIVWRRTVSGAVSGQGFSMSHDHILCYTKQSDTQLSKLPLENITGYNNSDNDPRGLYKKQKLERTLEGARPTMTFEIQTPSGPIIRTWAVSKNKFDEMLSDNRIVFSSSGTPYYKQFLNEFSGRLPDTLWDRAMGSNQEGSKELKALFGVTNLFNNPKPTKLIRHAMKIAANEPNAVILDFFLGSGSSADAVLKMNSEDGGNRRFIGVQLPEPTTDNTQAYKFGFQTISEISKERIRRVGKKILERECHTNWSKDIGFRTLKIDTSNMADVWYSPDQTEQQNLLGAIDNIREDRTPEDLLFQVLLDWGIDLSLSITRQDIDGKTVFFVDGSDKHMALAACFDTDIDEGFVKQLAEFEPLRVVFRDAGFASDSVKINVEQIFALESPSTEVKAI